MKLLPILLLLLCLTGCGSEQSPVQPVPEPVAETFAQPPLAETMPETIPTEPEDPMIELLKELTLEEKVGQLFLARCPEEDQLGMITAYQPGGYVLFDRDLEGQTPETLEITLDSYQDFSRIPMLIAVDEEGGTVCRVSNHKAFRAYRFPSPRSLYEEGGMEAVLQVEAEKANLLKSLGIHVNLAPVCDITGDPAAFLYSRSLGAKPETVSQFVEETVKIMAKRQVGSVLKHFPGYGNNADTHVGIAVDNRSLQALENCDLQPFAAGIRAGCGAVMVSHTIVTAMDDSLPASLSPAVHDYLRHTMGFEGVITTDDLVMDAISDTYGAEEAAVLAVLAGNDLLCCTEFGVQYEAVLEAVKAGRIPESRIDASVERILRWKDSLGLFN